MEEALELFTRHGTENERIEISADSILNATAEVRDVDCRYAIIEGSLDIGRLQIALNEPRMTTGYQGTDIPTISILKNGIP